MAICKFNVSGFLSHLFPAIFSCAKRLFLRFDIANWCVLPYFNVILIMNTLACSANSFAVYCTVILLVISLRQLMNWKPRTFTENGLVPR